MEKREREDEENRETSVRWDVRTVGRRREENIELETSGEECRRISV